MQSPGIKVEELPACLQAEMAALDQHARALVGIEGDYGGGTVVRPIDAPDAQATRFVGARFAFVQNSPRGSRIRGVGDRYLITDQLFRPSP
jgi:hypothetical protein